MSPDNNVGRGSGQSPTMVEEKRIVRPPDILGLSPIGWETGVSLYRWGNTFELDLEEGIINATNDGKKMGLSPRKPLFGEAVGWEIQAAFPIRGGETAVSYSKVEEGLEGERFCNIWWGDSDGVRRLAVVEGKIQLYTEPVAIIPVPEKPLARLPEERGGVIIVSLFELKKTQRILEEFLRPRFQGR